MELPCMRVDCAENRKKVYVQGYAAGVKAAGKTIQCDHCHDTGCDEGEPCIDDLHRTANKEKRIGILKNVMRFRRDCLKTLLDQGKAKMLQSGAAHPGHAEGNE